MEYKFSSIWEKPIKGLINAVINQDKLPFKIMNLKGARLSGKTKMGLALPCISLTQAKIKVYGFRYFISDLEPRLITDFLIILDNIGIKYNYVASKKKIYFANGSEFEFFGLKKRSSDEVNLKGLPECGNYDYVFIIKDEITEYDNASNEAVNEAIRGLKTGKVLEIRTWNANIPDHFANRHLLDYLSEDEKCMKSTGYKMRTCYTKENDCIEFFSQNNVFTNPFIGEEELRNLVSQRFRDPLRAHTMLFGLDGLTDMQTYPNLNFQKLNFSQMIDIIHQDIAHLEKYVVTLGWDYGLNDKSSLVMTMIHKEMGIFVLGSWSYSRKRDGLIDEEHLAELGAEKLEELLKLYNLNNKTIYYDCDNLTIVEWMQKKMKVKTVKLQPAKKWKIADRIVLLRMIMDKEKLTFIYGTKFDQYQTELKREIRMSQLEENLDGEVKRRHGENDMLNSLEYSMFYVGKNFYEYLFRKWSAMYDW